MTNLPGISPQPPTQWQQENRDFIWIFQFHNFPKWQALYNKK